ncbi:MAG: hypothetical protein IPJ78_00105 [Gemmatimonadetes bacterium]|nr:hypothetical protein [Gemmatimonadota bacterium]
MNPEKEFFDRLQSAVPAIAALRAAHEADYGELLGHVLMADVKRWACETLAADPTTVTSLLGELDRALGPSDDPVSNMISVSFLEGLGRAGSPSAEQALRAQLPHRLAEDLRSIESWHSDGRVRRAAG